VLKALENCISKEKFIEKMKQFGWSVNWTEKRKHITFQNQDGKKVRDSNLSKTFHLDISKEGLEKKQLEEERERLQKRVQELEELINGEKEILMKKNVPVEQMLKYLGYKKLTRKMLEEYVQGIYVYDDGRVERVKI
jgi:site-specific DNA recombinase